MSHDRPSPKCGQCSEWTQEGPCNGWYKVRGRRHRDAASDPCFRPIKAVSEAKIELLLAEKARLIKIRDGLEAQANEVELRLEAIAREIRKERPHS